MEHTRPDIEFTEEDLALLQLSLCDGIGPKLSYQLLAHFGSGLELFRAVKSGIGSMPISFSGLAPQKLMQLQQASSLTEAKDTLKIHQKLRIQILSIHHPLYPTRIKEQNGAPLVLYCLGNPIWNASRSISVVGTRKPSKRGISITKEIITELKHKLTTDWISISGLALGIDAVAHKTSIEQDIPTIAVVAHGLEQIYPRNHQKLSQDICNNGGAILSEHPAYTKMHPTLFPRRNRLVAAMGDALLITESGTTGGSMVTAGIACHLNKEVFAVPGYPKDSLSAGCNSLIQECMAHLCCSGTDIINKMNWGFTAKDNSTIHITNKTTDLPSKLQSELSKTQTEILGCIRLGINRLQDIAEAMPFCSTAEILSALIQLQLLGILVKENQQQFCLVTST